MRSIAIISIFYVTSAISQVSTVKEVGIPEGIFPTNIQERSNWCWAASIQSILQYYHINKTQTDIVYHTFGTNYLGELPNWGGTAQNVANNLNNWGVTWNDNVYLVKSNFYNRRPSDDEIIDYLSKKQPLYLSYKSGKTSNHAVVITNCKFIETAAGREIIEITLTDPWLSDENVQNGGIVRYTYENFYPLMNYFWAVYVNFEEEVNTSIEMVKNHPSVVAQRLLAVLDGFENEFIEIRGDKYEGTKALYYSKDPFPGSINKRGDLINNGEYPSYTANFYKGDNSDSASLVYERLKSEFQFLGDLNELQKISPLKSSYPYFEYTQVNINLGYLIIVLSRYYSEHDETNRYRVTMNVGLTTSPLSR